MVEYPIQERYPYQPQLEMAMKPKDVMYWLSWYMTFGSLPADFIRSHYAWRRLNADDKILSSSFGGGTFESGKTT